jgi:hypothetical protein
MSGVLARWLFLGGVLLACDGVGRSVVGERAVFVPEVCKRPVPCEPLTLLEPEAVPEAATPVDLTQCMQAGTTLCPASATTPAGQCTAPAPALERTFQAAFELALLGCTAVHLVHAANEPALARIELQSWNQVHLDIESAEAVTLELVGGKIEHVSVALHGPITLRVVDGPSVRDLRVLGGSSAAQIELVRATVEALAIDGSQAQVLLRRSSLKHVRLAVQRINLESSFILNAAWQAQTLNASDASLQRVRSAATRSVLSSCDVEMTSFMGCQSLTAVQGMLTDVQMFSCAEEIGLYGATVSHSQLEGDLILDAASLGRVVLGLGDVGSVATWDTHLSNISFCADQQPLTFGGTTGVHCGHCNLTPEPAQPAACRLQSAEPAVLSSSSCPELLQLPVCGDPLPERMRPPRR